MKRNCRLALVVVAVVGVVRTLAAAECMTQEEIGERFRQFEDMRRPDSILCGYRHIDHGFNTNGKFEEYDYLCPACGKVTEYRKKIVVGNDIDVAGYLKWARESLSGLRSMRLDIRLDERTLCAYCRHELKIPDGGEIVEMPEVWPSQREPGERFPFAVGEVVDILKADYGYSDVYIVERPDQVYWISVKEMNAAVASRSDRVMINIRMGAGDNFPPVGTVTCWVLNGVVRNSETNGWIQYKPDYPIGVRVTEDVLGNLTYAGEKSRRDDIYTPIWTINGKHVDLFESDVEILSKFLEGTNSWQYNEYVINKSRLVELLRPDVHTGRLFRKWHPPLIRRDDGTPVPRRKKEKLDLGVEIEVDI